MSAARVIKWIVSVAAALALLLVLAVVAITSWVDPNRFRGRIEAAVREATGMPFKINGDLEIAWYPWLAVRMGPAQLGARQPVLRWKSASVGAQLIPLIHGQFLISRIRLNGAEIRLLRDQEGHANWDSLLTHRDKKSRSQTGTLESGGIEIRNSSLEYLDASADARVQLTEWKFDMDEWEPGEPFAIETRFSMQYGDPSALKIPIALKLPEIRIHTQPMTLAIPKFDGQLADAKVGGSLDLTSVRPLRGGGALSMETDSLRQLLADLGIGGPRPRDAKTLGLFKMTTHWAAGPEAVSVKPFEMQLDQTKIHGEIDQLMGAEPAWSFNLAGDHIILDHYTDLEDDDDLPFELPVAELKALRARGVLSFRQARIAGAQMKNVRLRFEMEDGKLHGVSR